MKERILKSIMAVMLIITLTMANFILMGVNVVSYAVGVISQDEQTSNKNVKFKAYFKTEEGKKVTQVEESIEKENMKLYMEVGVEKEGYFNGEITLQESNFELKEEKLSEKINKIEKNKISLDQIEAGEKVEIEVGIRTKRGEEIDLSLLNMESKIDLKGIYTNAEAKKEEVKAQKEVELNLESPYKEEQGGELEAEIITNKKIEIEGSTKRLLQIRVKSGLEQNRYPIRNTEIKIGKIEGIEEIKVTTTGTDATNGEEARQIQYSEEEGKIKVEIANEQKDGKISWKKEGRDKIIVTYILEDEKEIKGQEIEIEGKVQLYDSKSTIKENKVVAKVEEEKDGTIEIKTENNEKEIYKGKIYSKEAREYKTEEEIRVNYEKIEEIEIKEKQAMYETEEKVELLADVEYKETKINKEKMQEVLGQEGKIEIEANGRITEITSKIEADEQGNIIVKYEQGIKEIKITLRRPEKTGIIKIEHTKQIKEENKKQEEIKEYKKLKQEIELKHNEVIKTQTNEINLQETETKAKIEINRKDLSTMIENQNVEIKVTLETNNEKYDLYKNPTIKIGLPKQVEQVKVNSINLFYEDEMKVKTAKLVDKTIEIQLEGEQTKYTENEVAQGATIIINANLKLDKKQASSKEAIKLNVKNEKGKEIQEEKQIEIIAPTGIVVANTIEGMGITAIGEEETKTTILETGKEAKEEEVKIEIINNNEAKIEDVKILGTFPTKSNENTIDAEITKQIEVEGKQAKIYYSTKENATEELTAENEWKETIESGKEVKKYLMMLDSMETGEEIKATYNVGIPAGLKYNEEAKEGYMVAYTNTLTGSEEKAKATEIEVKTGVGPEIKVALTAEVGGKELKDGDEVSGGEVVKYEVTIENTGTEDATNVKFEEIAPENTTFYNEGYKELYDLGFRKSIPEYISSKSYAKLAKGEKIVETYEVAIDKKVQDNISIVNKINVSSDQISAESNESKLVTKLSKISARVLQDGEGFEDHILVNGYGCYLILQVENSSDEDLNDVKVDLTTDDKYIFVESIFNSEKYEGIQISDKSITINQLPKNTKMIFGLDIYALNDQLNQKDKGYIYSTIEVDKNKYLSNVMEYTIIPTLQPSMIITQSSDTANQYVKDGDKINYTIKLKNNGQKDLSNIILKDAVPNKLTVLKVEKDGKIISEFKNDNGKITQVDNNIKITNIVLKQGEETEIKITALVEKGTQSKQTIKLVNTAEAVCYGDNLTVKAEDIIHYVETKKTEESDPSKDPTDNNNDNDKNNKKYSISGIAWFDEDGNGQKDSSEALLSDIAVKLIDVKTNKIVKDSSGKELKATTDKDGFYALDKIEQGKYIVIFEYDSTKYIPTSYKAQGVAENKNSNAILNTINIDGKSQEVASTDTYTITNKNISDVNIGLKEIKTFDMKLDKFISKISVNNSKGTKNYNYDDSTFAKLELHSKAMVGSNIVVEYEIRVTNNGDAEGYVRSIVDYLPKGLKFSSELNKDWYQLNSNVYNTSLANELLRPGETKSVKLVLTKTVTSGDSEIISNTAEIAESYTALGLEDINSIAGNKAQGENDMGRAEFIISVETGEIVKNVTLITMFILMIIGVSVYFINKKVIRKM